MKKIFNFIGHVLLVLVFSFAYLFSPITIKAKEATTIAELKQNLKELEAKKAEMAKKKSSTQSEINTKKNNISKANHEKEEIEVEVDDAKSKVEQANKDLEQTSKDIDSILKYYQLSMDSNEYINYIMGSSTTTEMIMRVSAVEQISSYYKNKLEQLKELIKEKEDLQVELNNKNEELDKKIVNYSNAIESLNNELSIITDTALSIDEEIKAQQDVIKMYQSICDSETQLLSTCTKDPQSYGWTKPMVKGRISSNFGWRNGSFHNAYDIAGNPEGTPEYAAANGIVGFTLSRTSCGGNRAYIWVTVNGVKYTLEYAHMLEIKVKSGQKVTTDTIIGTVGGYSTMKSRGGYDGCSGGAHLHFGVSKGWYKKDYKDWSTFIANAIKPPGFPGIGVWWYKR